MTFLHPHTVRTSPVSRLTAVDALRGAVMVIMALDHVRDFIHAGAMSFSPEDLTRTTPALFATRWITHFCAPTFAMLVGVGAALRLQRDGSKARLSGFLVTRGLWLIAIELILMRLAMNFTLSTQYPVLLLILWALGIAMIALAALVHLPKRLLLVVAIALIALHNTLDGVDAAQLGALAGVWRVLHQQGVLAIGGLIFVVGYPVLPWIGVAALGFCLGGLFELEPPRRRRTLLTIGIAMTAAFVVLRLVNVYGDPSPWSAQPSPLFTAISFLRTTKYPPSLAFLLMTLGPSLVALALLDRVALGARHPLVVFGRVPFFYYVAHFWAAHVAASLLAWARYGEASLRWLFTPLPSMGGPRELYPADFGFSLGATYLVWLAIVLAMYPACRWFGNVKARHADAWWAGYV